MPEVIETIVYTFDELTPAAQETARNWYREHAPHYGWWQWVYEDFEAICKCLGITIKQVPMNGRDRATGTRRCIWFSGFWNQGDGACFEGSWRYERGSSLAIRAHAPQDRDLHEIADRLQAVQKRNFYQLVADISHRDRYYHAHCMDIRVERDTPTWQTMTADAEEIVIDVMRDLAKWLYRTLEAEYDFQTSDAEIDAALEANGYTFTQDGRRFG